MLAVAELTDLGDHPGAGGDILDRTRQGLQEG
jgi:hypothetical protein